MEFSHVAAALLSAVLHAGWNAAVKASRKPAETHDRANGVQRAPRAAGFPLVRAAASRRVGISVTMCVCICTIRRSRCSEAVPPSCCEAPIALAIRP
jgi:hypothetical protein